MGNSITTQFHLTAGPGLREISTIAYNGYDGGPGNSTLATHNVETGNTNHVEITGINQDMPHAVAWDKFGSRMVIIHQNGVGANFTLGFVNTTTGEVTNYIHAAPITTSKIKSLIAPAADVIMSLHADGTIIRWDSNAVTWETTWSGSLIFTGDEVPRMNTAVIRTLAVNPNDGKIYCVMDAGNSLQAIANFNLSDMTGAGTWDINMSEHLLLDHTQSLVWMNTE